MAVTPDSLQAFVQYCQEYIKGDEKSESQTFLTRFFQAFGHGGIQEIGAEFEQRVKKGSKKDKTGFADLVWKPSVGVAGVVIEMKSRGIDLSLHYSQLERYWMRLTPKPKYSILCNFDEFWIYDFTNQVDEPVDRVRIEELPERLGTFSFMEIGGREPIFRNNQVEVTERTAKRMGEFYRLVRDRGQSEKFKYFTEEQLQRFTLQCVLAMFAEDRGLLPSDLFVSLIQDALQGRGDSYDLFSGLFGAMNDPLMIPSGRFKGVEYFNGGLFKEIRVISLEKKELEILDVCARDNWRNIRPSIFGNIFEGAIDTDERHAHGIHYTSETDIRQIVRPTISDYWEERIEAANSIGELNGLQLELQNYRVLDPACGSGNFLYVAYQELKRIEQLLIQKIAERKKEPPSQMEMSFVTPLQFFGMDTNKFAVQLARVTMMIARKIAIDKFDLHEPALPLDTLDENIVCKDALFTEWAKADAIIGNPPFLGGKKLREELGDRYVEKLHKRFPDVHGQPDFCVFWFRKAVDCLDKFGRAGLVGTNSISQNTGRKASLDYIFEKGAFIHDAISSQAWSGDAVVHVSLVNWSQQKPKKLFLDGKEVSQLSSSLQATISVSISQKLQCNVNYSFEGCKLIGKGFVVSSDDALNWIKKSSKNSLVVKPMIDGRGLINSFQDNQWVIDFYGLSLEQARKYKEPFKRVQEMVKPEREQKNNQKIKEEWWLFERSRPAMRKALEGLQCYFALPKIAKWTMFTPVDVKVLPCEANMVIASDDFYVLGILTSDVHRQWVKAQSSTLEDRTRYTNTTCFETFPFPQTASKKITEQIRQVTIDLHTYRTKEMIEEQWSITQLYNAFFNEPASQLYKLHKKLDDLVLKAYGFKKDDDILEKLLALNLELAEKEKQGEKIIGPWAIDNPPNP